MFSHAITMTVLTHPLQVLLIGMVLARLALQAFAMATRGRPAPTDSNGTTMRAAAPSDLQAA